MLLRVILLSLAVLSFGFHSISQTNRFSFNIKAYETKADFHKNVNKLPIGISFGYSRAIEDSRFSYGAEFGVAMYNVSEMEVKHDNETFNIVEEDCFLTFHAFVRYNIWETDWSMVYGEARIGTTTFFSSRVAEDYDSDFESSFDFHGTAFNTGFGGGLMINPASIMNRANNGIWIDLGASFNRGSRARYRMAPEGTGNYTLEDGQYRSLTHYVEYRIGLVVDF